MSNFPARMPSENVYPLMDYKLQQHHVHFISNTVNANRNTNTNVQWLKQITNLWKVSNHVTTLWICFCHDVKEERFHIVVQSLMVKEQLSKETQILAIDLNENMNKSFMTYLHSFRSLIPMDSYGREEYQNGKTNLGNECVLNLP